MRKEEITKTIDEVLELTIYNTLTTQEKLILCSNLLLLIVAKELPLDLQTYSTSLLNNGKELALKSTEYKNNIPLQIAVKAHLIVDMAGKL
jgi:hypothetical protein